MEPRPFKRPLLTSLAVMLALLIGAWYLDFMIAIMVCVLVLLLQVVRLLYYAVMRNIHGLKLTGLRLLVWMAAVFATAHVMGYYAGQARTQGDALVAALQRYHAREGRYPEKLEALAPRDIVAIPVAVSRPSHEQKFHYRGEQKRYRLMYGYAFKMGYEYDSETAKWVAFD